MTLSHRAALMGMAAATVLVIGIFAGRGLLKERGDQELRAYLQKASISEAYVLRDVVWTAFGIPPETTVLRIVTNANVARSARLKEEELLSIVLRYQVLDRKGTVMVDRQYTQRSGKSEFIDRQSGERVPAYFYFEEGLQPLDGKIITLNLGSVKGAAAVRFLVAERDPMIVDVGMRVYAAERNAEERLKRIWLRMTDYQKERLASGNVYPVDLVSEEERQNMLRNMLKPLGPAGIMGRDYNARKLYVLMETFDREYDMPIMPAGLFIEKGFRGVIPVPAGGGRMKLSFTGTGYDTPAKGSRIRMRWFGRTAFKRSERVVSWPGRAFDFEQRFDEGVIEIEPSLDVVVRAFHLEGDKDTEITPETLYQRAAVAERGHPVDFEVNHESGRPTPFRIDLRALTGPLMKDAGRAARYSIFDGQGRVIGQGTIPFSRETSLYDRYSGDMQDVRVSEPTSYYFRLPAAARLFRVSAEDQILVAAYNRPPGLVRELRVPEDYLMTLRNLDKHPSWFYLKPLEFNRLFEEKRTVLLTIQYRPPEDIPDLIAGKYDWEDFHPQGKWRARDLLTPWDSAGIYRPESLAALYRRVSNRGVSRLTFGGVAGLKMIQPRLIFLRTTDRAATYEVTADGVVIYRGKMTAISGSTPLPPLKAGSHDMGVTSEGDTEFYVSNVLPSDDTKIIRLGNLMTGELDFIYEKKTAEDEVLSARLHVPASRKAATSIRVTVEGVRGAGIGPWASLTLPERLYHVSPAPGAPVPVLNTRGEGVDQGEVFYIPLGSDLHPGKYRIRFRLEDGEHCYLVFYRLTPGIAAKRNILIEGDGRRMGTYE